jgi:tRNA G46 methylase TrmB
LRAPRTDASLVRMPQLERAEIGAADARTAKAFATSWNNLPAGSVYTPAQFKDWLDPITPGDVEGRDVLELGCGNGSLLVHMAGWRPRRLVGVDLGDSVVSARENLQRRDIPVARSCGTTSRRIARRDSTWCTALGSSTT